MGRGYTFRNERFKDLRVRSGMTQDELAQAVGMSKSQISRIENGGHNPYQRTIARLAGALGVERDELIQYDSDTRLSAENREKVGEAQREWERKAERSENGEPNDPARARDRGT